MAKSLNAEEFTKKLMMLKANEHFDFFTEMDSCGDLEDGYAVIRLDHFDADVFYINYYGGSTPYIIDVTLDEDDSACIEFVQGFMKYIGVNGLWIQEASTTTD